MKILYAEESDINEMEVIARKTFYKMGLDELGGTYDQETFVVNTKMQIKNDNYIVLKCIEDNKLVGGLFAYHTPQLYNQNKTIIQEFGMQSSPELSKTKQSKIIIALIKYLEDLAKEIGAHTMAFNLMEKHDLSKYLIKKGYKKSDIIYVRSVK